MRTKWEVKVCSFAENELEDGLNRLGEEEWEPWWFIKGKYLYRVIFKRPVEEVPEEEEVGDEPRGIGGKP